MKKVQFLRETERGSAQYGPTKFSDLTEEEFKERHLGFYPPKYDPVMNVFESDLEEAEIPEDVELPDAFDWRTLGAVTPVKNQGKYLPNFKTAKMKIICICTYFSTFQN